MDKPVHACLTCELSPQTAADRLKPGNKSTIMPLLDKAREMIPQPEPKKGARAGGAGAKPSAVRGGARPATGGGSAAPAAPAERKTSKTNGRPAASKPSSAPAARKKGEDVDASPLYVASNLKNARFKDEAKLKLLKWNFPAPRQGSVQQSCLPSQLAFQSCNVPQLLNTKKNVQFHINLYFNLQF